MNPLRKIVDPLTPGARKALTRRRFLTASAAFAVGVTVDQVVEQAIVEPLLEPPQRIEPTSMEMAGTLRAMRHNNIARARDIAAEHGGFGESFLRAARDAGVPRNATIVRKNHDGRQIIEHHGEDLVLWDDRAHEELIGVPLDQQPDRDFGRFADRCMAECMMRQTQTLHARRAETMTKDGWRIISYLAWTASDGERAISVALTADQIDDLRIRGIRGQTGGGSSAYRPA